ncbi:LysR substrate-binding domain-containing protein [Amphritea sp. 1_MG-2023]|uniref:LysR family transcriptional regulator n=1 Tax=Amphritea sp. 1_MG-2023 TaxID=3062670 RepID=UPI0026E1661A|nr:LysR substrate-binding domain-containing protein [Amphritea sp. 1_MG-2023]MDO6561785.1 LysR substrate-binding domain-containing protein [Amphritea sp. 1_MG-2023]
MDLDLKTLALFVRITSLGAIGRAGEEFGLSSTNASQRIQALEVTLGVKLFHRTTRVVTLTHDGQVFLEHAKRILDDVEETWNVFKGDDDKVQGKIRLTVSASYGRIYLVPFIPELLAKYPHLQIEIDFTDKTIDIVEQGYDIAFRMHALESTSLLARRIADNPMILVASPAYLQQWGILKHRRSLLSIVAFRLLNLTIGASKIRRVKPMRCRYQGLSPPTGVMRLPI